MHNPFHNLLKMHKWQTEHFINRPDIEFKKCHKCGKKELPKGMYKVFDGTRVVIVWPT